MKSTRPTNIKYYYKSTMRLLFDERNDLLQKEKNLIEKTKLLHDDIKQKADFYKKEYNFSVLDYKEFEINQYVTGTFGRAASRLYNNKNNGHNLDKNLYHLYDYALTLEEIEVNKKRVVIIGRCLEYNMSEYINVLRIFFYEVHRQIVLEANAYYIAKNVGYIFFNKVKLTGTKKMVLFNETNKRKRELLAEGKNVYNKDEEKWCKERGIEYKAVDYRVYKTDTYFYELCLLGTKTFVFNKDNAGLYMEKLDYRGLDFRGVTNEEIIEKYPDVNQIINLNLDMRTKLILCEKLDENLTNKFVRNENQKSIKYSASNWKN